MNPNDEKTPNIDWRLMDVLVDGELSDTQRGELLQRLDRTPGGWRACALAFLEAQCLRESLGSMSREPAVRHEKHEMKVSPLRPRKTAWTRRVGTFVAMAASFLAVLAIGWWAGTLRRPGVPENQLSGPEANAVAVEHGPTAPRQVLPPASRSPMTTVALPPLEKDGQEQGLPFVEGEQLDPSLLYPDAAAIPAEVRDALRRAGFRVRQSHELLPVPVGDGRRAIVPIDQLDVHYVGHHVE